jgi:filamentous hemagglutinin family protein
MHRRFHALLLATTALMPCATALAGGPTPPSPTELPTNPQTQGGSATYTTNANTLTVNQSSQNLITNWNTFNIGSSAAVNFFQPNASAIALNRVTGDTNPSQIMGTLTANGIVFLVNPNGVIFGKNSTVNAAGFLATTHDIKNSDFMAGKYNFTIPGNPTASIVNFGNITAASGGFAALVAPGVRNDGVITAQLGTVGLASSGQGFTLDMYGDKLITLAVNDSVASQVMDVSTGLPLTSLVGNNGTLSANGGKVQITAAAAKYVVDSVINNKGVIEANAVAQRGGTIVLAAATGKSKPAGAPAQNVRLAGTISAAGKNAG